MRTLPFVLALALVAGCSGEKEANPKTSKGKSPPAAKKGPPLRTTADALFAEYHKNLLDADLKYSGKQVELSGVPGKVEKDAEGRYFIGACSKRFINVPPPPPIPVSPEEAGRRIQEAALSAKYLPAVMIYLQSDTVAGFAGLQGGKQQVTVRGHCKGSVSDKGTTPGFFVVVEDAVLVRGH